jgi:hypothetical protein
LTHFGAYLEIYDGFIDTPTHATGSAGNEFAMVNVRETARAAMVLLGRTHAELFEATLRPGPHAARSDDHARATGAGGVRAVGRA